MYGLTLDATYFAMQSGQMPDVANFKLDKLCPYMTQPVEVHLYPDGEQIPVVSWQLARQLEQSRENHPELRAFRFLPLKPEDGWPTPTILNTLENVSPGRLLLLTANLRRGLGDMVLLMPIFKAQAQRLHQLGWGDKISISASNRFAGLFYGQEFLDTFLPEFPSLYEIMQFDYAMEYGLNLTRMRNFIGVSDWREIDLRVQLFVPEDRVRHWQSIIMEDSPRIFVNWVSFDQQRTLSPELFKEMKTTFPQFSFYTSIRDNYIPGEIFPGGPQNLRPYEKDMFDLFAILANMDIVITTNTGIAHIAAGLGKPTIVVFSGRLYGWDDYWPDLYPELYPTMYPIGLDENLSLMEDEIKTRIMDKLAEISGKEVNKLLIQNC